MQRLLPLTAVLAALAVPAAAAAQYPMTYPTSLDVRSDGHRLTLTEFSAFRPGPVRLSFAPMLHTKIFQRYVVARLHDGVEPADAAAIGRLGELQRVATLVSGVRVRPSHTHTIDRRLGPGRYVVLNRDGDRPYAAFEVAGAPRDERLERATARLRIGDTGFSRLTVLDRRDRLRIDNAGDRPHNVLSIRVRRGLTTAQAERRLRRGVDPERLGIARELLGVVSPGTSNRVLLDLQYRGRYLLASTYGRDLVRAVEVR